MKRLEARSSAATAGNRAAGGSTNGTPRIGTPAPIHTRNRLSVAATAGTAAGTAAAAGLAVLCRERGAAAAGARRIGVVDLEATAHRILYVVYGRAAEIVDAHRVDQHPHPI